MTLDRFHSFDSSVKSIQIFKNTIRMPWYMCPKHHVIECRATGSREVYCRLCNKVMTKAECTKCRIVKARKIRRSQRGKKNPMFGKHHTPESLQKLREIMKGKNNPMHGKHHTPESRQKMSEGRRKYWNRKRLETEKLNHSDAVE